MAFRRAMATATGAAAATVVSCSATSAATVEWSRGCLPFLAPAEIHYHLPRGLLAAIALTESGQDGTPYPWALNIAGEAVIAPSYEAAARLLRLPDGTPRHDVAVGCMQIHMQYHLDKFVEPEWALHPRYNVWYAALFLDELRRHYGDWVSAIAHYHGSDPAAQRQYLCRVAGHLATTAPGTREALGLADCGSARIAAADQTLSHNDRARKRLSLLAARRVGSIIVLGRERQ